MNEFVNYLNSINNIGGNSTGSLAEYQVKSPFYDYIKIDRRIGNHIANSVSSQSYRAYILTGHAGDGKTSILVQVLKMLSLLAPGEGLDVHKEYSNFFYIKDMSEIPEAALVNLLEKALQAPGHNKTSLLITNTGPLLKSFLTLAKKRKNAIGSELSPEEEIELRSTILTQLDKNEDKEIELAGYRFVFVNIARLDNVAFATKILKKIANSDLWSTCDTCSAIDRCPIRNNQELITSHYERISTFIDNYYRYLYENDKRMTIRQMVGQICFGLTGNLSCDEICNRYLKEPFFTYNFANSFFGYLGLDVNRDSLQINGIKHIQNLALDKIALNVDYKLFVNHDYNFFPKNIRKELVELEHKSRKYFQVSDENIAALTSEQRNTANLRMAVRRFYFIYGVNTAEYSIDGIFNQIFGKNFIDYKKMITSAQPSSMVRKMQNVVFNALYIKNTGFLPNGSSDLPLTLRREDDVYQSALLVLGEVNKSDIRVVSYRVTNQLEDTGEKYELYIQLKDALFKLSLPMIKYFNDLINGTVASNSNPALTHGIASLDTLLLDQFGEVKPNRGEDCEISIIINTTKGQQIQRLDFNSNRLYIE